MRLFTLFISYRSGGNYCGVYPQLGHLYDVIKEMARDEDIDHSEIPSIDKVRQAVKGTLGDFQHQFQNGIWIHVQETTEQLVEVILDQYFEGFYKDIVARIDAKLASLPESKEPVRCYLVRR